jgi:hypothetical protein
MHVATDVGTNERQVALHPGLLVVGEVPYIVGVIQDQLIRVAQIETVLEPMELLKIGIQERLADTAKVAL